MAPIDGWMQGQHSPTYIAYIPLAVIALVTAARMCFFGKSSKWDRSMLFVSGMGCIIIIVIDAITR